MDTARNRILPIRSRLTYEDYLELPDDGRRYEILDGEIAVTPAPTTPHQYMSAALLHLLWGHAVAPGAGLVFSAPVDVILADDCIVQPDLVYIAASRAAIVKKRGIEGPPDLIVEILSKSTAQRDRTTKANIYARYGVRCYWLVDPEKRTFEAYERGKRRYRRAGRFTRGDVVHIEPFPDLAIDLAALWPRG